MAGFLFSGGTAMNELIEIAVAPINEIPCICVTTIIGMAIKHGFKHISCKYKDTFELDLDK